MNKLGIVITDEVGFRNFIMSDFITEASQQYDSIIIYSNLPIRAFSAFLKTKITINKMNFFVEGKVTWFFRKWKEVAYQSFLQKKNNQKQFRER